MNSDDLPRQGDADPKDLKEPWQLPVIEYLNLASGEADGGANYDGQSGSS